MDRGAWWATVHEVTKSQSSAHCIHRKKPHYIEPELSHDLDQELRREPGLRLENRQFSGPLWPNFLIKEVV